MPPFWIEISVLSLLLVVFTVYLYLKYRAKPKRELVVAPDACCFCGKEERERFFCRACYPRLVHRYAAIVSGICCLPVGAAGGYLSHLLTGQPVIPTVFVGVGIFVIGYNVLAISYFIVYMPERIKWFIGFLGFGFVIDPRGLSFTIREEWWRLKLLLKQAAGVTKSRSAKNH